MTILINRSRTQGCEKLSDEEESLPVPSLVRHTFKQLTVLTQLVAQQNSSDAPKKVITFASAMSGQYGHACGSVSHCRLRERSARAVIGWFACNLRPKARLLF